MTGIDGVGMCVASLLAEPFAPTGETVREALDAAEAAGFRELSSWTWLLPFATDAGTIGAAATDLARRGLTLRCAEAATAWATGAPDDAAPILEAAEAFGADLLLAVCLEPTLAPGSQDRLAALADRAARIGTRVCVEFLPWTGLPTLAAAWELVEPLGDGVGLLVDTWHWQRQPGVRDLDLLASIPKTRLPYVQVSDALAAPEGELMDETMNRRLLPGDGVIDYPPLLARVGEPWTAIELFNPSIVRSLGAAKAAVAMRDATAAMLATA
jgi:sugar phosphate isomerase/epimerase